MNAILYHRVSKTEQNATNAREDLRSTARRLGYEVVLDIEEVASGAKNASLRPGLAQVLQVAESGTVQAVIIHKLDRFGRNALDLLTNIKKLEECGVRFICTSQNVDVKPGVKEPLGKLLLTVLAGIAEFERDLISQRTKLGLDRVRMEGRQLGRARKNNISRETVQELRATGKSWSQVSKLLGCNVSAARRA